MSIDRDTLDFLDRLSRDADMQAGLEEALAGAPDPLQATVVLVVGSGHAVTADGLDAARQAPTALAELDESEPRAVAEGFNRQPEAPARIGAGDLRDPGSRCNTRLRRRWAGVYAGRSGCAGSAAP